MDFIFEHFAIEFSFAITLIIGFFAKRFWTIPIFLIFGAVFGFGVALLYINFHLPTTKAGLGIIVLLPAVLIISTSLNTISALIGGLIGTWLGKRRKKLPLEGSLRKD